MRRRFFKVFETLKEPHNCKGIPFSIRFQFKYSRLYANIYTHIHVSIIEQFALPIERGNEGGVRTKGRIEAQPGARLSRDEASSNGKRSTRANHHSFDMGRCNSISRNRAGALFSLFCFCPSREALLEISETRRTRAFISCPSFRESVPERKLIVAYIYIDIYYIHTS